MQQLESEKKGAERGEKEREKTKVPEAKEGMKARVDEEGYTRVEKPRAAASWQRPRMQSPKRFEGPIHNCGLCKEKHWV